MAVCTFIFSYFRYCLTAFEATFSRMLNTGLEPLFVSFVKFSFNVAIVQVYVMSFTRVDNIAFNDQSYIINIDVLPSVDMIGKFPV